MASQKIPMETTKVPARRSQTEIMDMLGEVGFEMVGTMKKGDKNIIFSSFGSANFVFTPETETVLRILFGTGSYYDEDKKKAERVAWRLIWHHVKTMCDSIKVGVLGASTAFAGYMAIPNANGDMVTLGDQIAQGVKTGNINSFQIFNQLAIENKVKE